MDYTKKTDHVLEALSRFIEQFKDQPDIAAVLTSYVLQIQDLECALSDLLTETTLQTSVGQHLDDLGDLVGEPRAGRDDEQYRTAIIARIGLNTSNGTIEDVIGIIISVAGAPVTVTITEFFPAGFLATINEPIDPNVTDIVRMASFVASGRPIGVRGLLEFHPENPFAYDVGLGYDEGAYGGAVEA